ncbi:hypothetical protein VNI00_005740 [Paramarasmius palmivorus]|uniref:Cleavage/polyadenylation specificity factor A subunit N-terminal domain-containing protein n=1 Tax=Paramarasmius palmivorus TaxID=297713 RepID=A0AAW0DEW8_9AGAR
MHHVKTEKHADQVYLSYPYLVTFSERATTIFEIQPPSSLRRITCLSQTITGYLQDGAVINKIVVFNLHAGELQNTLSLFGQVTDAPIQYDHGRVLVTVSDETEEDGETKEDFWILACNPFDLEPAGYSFLTQIRRPCTEQHMLYSHIFPSRNHGLVVAQHTALTQQPLKLHYWSPEGQPYDESLPPSRTIEIPITLDDAGSMEARHAVAINDDTLAFSTVETVLDFLDGPGIYQSIIHVASLPSLEILWSSEPIDGEAKHVYHAVNEGIVLAIGIASERDDPDADSPDYATWLVALDAQNGKRRQFTKLNHRKIGKELVECSLTTSVTDVGEVMTSNAPDIVFVSSKGEVTALPLSKFLEDGLPSDDAIVLERSCHSSGLHLKDIFRLTSSRRASLGHKTAVVVDDEGVVSLFTW